MTMNVLDWERTFRKVPQPFNISITTKECDYPIQETIPGKSSLDFYLGPKKSDEKLVMGSEEMGITKNEFSQLIKKWKNENLL